MISKEQSDSLEGLLTCEELSNALKHTSNNKSPGFEQKNTLTVLTQRWRIFPQDV